MMLHDGKRWCCDEEMTFYASPDDNLDWLFYCKVCGRVSKSLGGLDLNKHKWQAQRDGVMENMGDLDGA